MRRGFQTVATAAAILLFYVSPVHAASPSVERKETRPLRVDVGLSAWISTGKTTWSHDASGVSSVLGNPSSKLDYKDVAANFVELSAKATLRDRWFARASFGFADIGGGWLVDDDFVSADGAASFGTTVTGAHRFSRTFSDVDGSDSPFTIIGALCLVALPPFGSMLGFELSMDDPPPAQPVTEDRRAARAPAPTAD